MSSSKLLDLTRSFSAQDKADFILFLQSPFFVRSGREEMLRFFQCVTAADKDNAGVLPDKAELHAILFPDKPFSKPRLERATTKLVQLTEQFVGVQHYLRPANAAQHELDLVGGLRMKNMTDVYEKQLSRIKKKAYESQQESIELYLLKYQIAKEEHDWKNLANDGKTDFSAPDVFENLSLFYYADRIDVLTRYLLQQKMGVPATHPEITYIIENRAIPDHYLEKSPILAIYKRIQDFFFEAEPSRVAFEQLLRLMRENEARLTHEAAASLYGFVRSYCSYLISSGQTELQVTLHEIQKENLTKGLFYYRDKINPTALLNIIRVALGIGEVAWAKTVAASNRHKIWNESPQEEIYKFCLASCLFEEKRFEEALDHLLYNFNFYFMSLLARRMELRIYYELHSELLPFKLDAFRKFLERTGSKKVSGIDWEANNHFVNILQQLLQARQRPFKRAASISKRIQSKKFISERKWLLEKATELA